jgi:hypothetical protein
MSAPSAAIVYAVSEGLITLVELLVKARDYPNMTEAEADAMVAETVDRAKKTLADWRSFSGQ